LNHFLGRKNRLGTGWFSPYNRATMATEYEHTLASSATLEGTSLHTGEKVSLTIKPAPEGHGFKFRRIDLADQPFIDADVDKVKTVERATTLAEGSVKVHTVEHVISALTGMGVDNAIIEMDANEPPIGDGSSKPFVELIKKAGTSAQKAPRRIWEIREPIHSESGDGCMITIVPSKTFRVSVTNVGPDGRFTQYFSSVITPEIYEKEISAARTFVYYEDVKPLLEKGLIKGGSLENAVVVRGDEIMSKEALRYSNEFARHKALDLIGDLMLSGKRILGHVIAIKPGHGPNTQMAATLKREYSRMRSMVPPIKIPSGEAVLDINDVLKILPHRYPFLLVDRIVDFEGDNKCTGVKNVTINEPFFPGHFPGHPVMPGVLQLEAMAQVSSVLMLRKPENQGKIGYFMSADNVKWRRPVLPGDTLFIEAEVIKIRGSIGQTKVRCLVNGEVVSEGELKFALIDS
jgi:UDP-3-O-[3-hydroxymyristoyl] N-acetylglucosamine deacetylase / 3-hydroxyacyl-[acyl-carrier-protein] dehydratase